MAGTVDLTKGFLDLGFNDYVAARSLLTNEMLPQGAGLTATTVEKYLKAYAASQGCSLRGHIGNRFVADLKSGPGIPPYLSEEFLRFLGKCYRLRYYDDIEAGYNVVIHRHQLLAELDSVVGAFEGAFTLTANGQKLLSKCQRALLSKDLRVLHDNHVVFKGDKTKYIEQEDAVYEIRFLDVMNIVEARYKTTAGKNDGNFSLEALVRIANGFQFAYAPILPPVAISWGPIGPEPGSVGGLSSLL